MSMRNARVRLRCCAALYFIWVVSYPKMTPGLFIGLSAARDEMQALQAACRWSLQDSWTLCFMCFLNGASYGLTDMMRHKQTDVLIKLMLMDCGLLQSWV